MSRFHDDRTFATNPGSLAISWAKIRELDPELMTDRTFRCGPICPVEHPSSEMRGRFEEHLQLGDSQPALVVSLAPLVVAAYSIDIDACVLLSFPASFVEQYELAIGARLLTVNTYTNVQAKGASERLYAVDLVPGPRRTGWSNFVPLIADFVCDDAERVHARKQSIAADLWESASIRANERVERFGLSTARDGRPSRVATPVRIGDLPYYVTSGRDIVPVLTTRRAPEQARASPAMIVAVVVILALALYLLTHRH
jgi:hypothetical protein